MSPLAPHPVGIKFWTNIWHQCKDKPFHEVHANFQNWYGHAFHRNFGKYFYAHRAGRMGIFAPMVTFLVGFKVVTMYYGTMRDLNAAQDAANAYGQGGYKTNPVPK
eukprot:TRINITY_DN2921_c0_g1_i1.p1 TRINITY_DN2921_c0_g1~~TRINITY_DN2921_c0_g1_i1.p1  ORF type:complete len:106 (-),score=28.61 TRINITY_DN2921_c0_g1_i1:157-474(-)